MIFTGIQEQFIAARRTKNQIIIMKTAKLLICTLLISAALGEVITLQNSVQPTAPQSSLTSEPLPIASPEPQTYTVQKVVGQPFHSNIQVQIAGQEVTVTGCNIHISQYRYFDDSSNYFGFDPFISTKRACAEDQDSSVISQLQIANSKEQTNSQLSFFDFMGEELLTLKKLNSNNGKKVQQKPVLVLLDGKYFINVENNPTFVVDGAILQIKGCNSHTFQFRIVDGVLQLGSGASTRIACPIDNDNFYISALQAAHTMTKNDNGDYQFKNVQGVVVLKAVSRDGSFALQLPSLPLLVANNQFRIEGCNLHTFNYEAYDDGVISFGPSSSTEKACVGDYDHVFLSYVLMSARFEIKDENIIYFFNVEERKLAVAQKIVKKKVTLDAGKYTLQVLSSSLPAITANIDSEILSFKGCNSVTTPYEAYNDGSISFTRGLQTLIACQVDNDSKYVAALVSAKHFEKSPTNSYILKNQEGKIIINLIPDFQARVPIPVNQRVYQGNYNIRLSGQSKINPAIQVELSPVYVKIIGCNLHSAEYDLFKDGGFSLKQVASTKRLCSDDQDQKYLQAFIDATKLGTSNNGLVLGNNQGDLAFLTNVEAQTQSAERYYYSLEESYRQFQGRYIVRAEDEVIPRIKAYVLQNYSHFLDQTRIVAGFRWYLLYTIRYEVIFRSIGGTDNFNVIMDYNPQTRQLKLQSLVLMDFTVLPISSQNCADMDASRCKTCSKGYGLFRGRCHKVEESCLLYDPEECFKCADGYELVKGKCRKNN